MREETKIVPLILAVTHKPQSDTNILLDILNIHNEVPRYVDGFQASTMMNVCKGEKVILCHAIVDHPEERDEKISRRRIRNRDGVRWREFSRVVLKLT
jgi:hypothetical protein